MKQFFSITILPLIFAFLLAGCSWMVNDRTVLVFDDTQLPLFPIEEFTKAGPCDYDMWPIEFEDDNKSYLVSEQAPTVKCAEENKQNRSDKNLLIKKVIDYNFKIETINKERRELEPIIIE